MRSIMRLCFTIVCLIGGFSGVVRAETLDRIVAVVNGDIILYSELQEQIRQLTKTSPDLKMEDPARRAQVEREMLQQMIRDRLADQEIQRLKIVVTAREVDEALDTVKQENHFTDTQLDYVIQQQGQTREQFRKGIKKELERSRLVERVVKNKTIITPEQVDAYLKSDESALREKRRLAILFIPIPEGPQGQKTEEVDKLARDVHESFKGWGGFFQTGKGILQGSSSAGGWGPGLYPNG